MIADDDDKKYHYYAFISYSRKDAAWAAWLQQKLETYDIKAILKQEGVPKYIRPIFRDKADISVGELEQGLHNELRQSKYLIVVCSPAVVEKEGWVNKEVAHFIQLGRENKIIPFIVSGTPVPKNDTDEPCYPPALSTNILGASLTELSKTQALYKVIAFIVGVKFDDLWQRHKRRKRRTLFRVIMACLLLLAIGLFSYRPYMKFQFVKSIDANKIPHLKEAFNKANGNLDSIRMLLIDSNNIGHAKVISEYCKHIDTLLVREVELKDLTLLRQFKTITCLVLYAVDSLKALNEIGVAQNLQVLRIGECDDLESLSGIDQLPRLKTLELYYVSALNSLSGMEHLHTLLDFDMVGSRKLTSVAQLKELHSLEKLSYAYNGILLKATDLTPLANLKIFSFPSVRPASEIDTMLIKKQHPGIVLELID